MEKPDGRMKTSRIQEKSTGSNKYKQKGRCGMRGRTLLKKNGTKKTTCKKYCGTPQTRKGKKGVVIEKSRINGTGDERTGKTKVGGKWL